MQQKLCVSSMRKNIKKMFYHSMIPLYCFLILNPFLCSLCSALSEQCVNDICWDDESYPHEEIMQKFYSKENYPDAFGKIHDPEPEVLEGKTSDNLCNVTYSLNIRPLSVIDGARKLYVLHTEKYHHRITITVCNPSQQMSQCVTSEDKRPLNYHYGCEQKYTRVKVLAYSFDEDEFKESNITYPSACRCESKIMVDDYDK